MPGPWTTALAILVLTFVASVLRELVLSPLAKFPGPRFAAITRLWMFYKTMQGQKFLTIHELHALYGPIVRIRPNELSISVDSAISTVYTSGACLKDPRFYGALDGDEAASSLVSLVDRDCHSARRKMLAHAFSRASTTKICETRIKPKLNALLGLIAASRGDRFDILKGSRAFSADFLADFIFGRDSGCLEEPDLSSFLTKAISVVSHAVPIALEFPALLKLPQYVSFMLSPTMRDVARLHEWAGKCWDEYVPSEDRPTVFERYAGQLRTMDTLKARALAVNDALAMLVGGTDNISSTISFASYELARDPSLQDRLYQELCLALPSPFIDEFPPWPALQRLPLLSAVIQETLRVYTAITTGLPRVAPAGGITVCGQLIPEGTVVSVQHWTVHRNQTAFPDPELFNPGRWINASFDRAASMDACFVPYSKGPRACIAKDLANAELYTAIAAIFRNFRTSLSPSSRIPANMTLIDKTVLDVASGKIELSFEQRD